MLTNGSLQGVTILKDKILEDNTGVASHPDIFSANGCNSSSYARFAKFAGTKTEHAVFVCQYY